MSNEEISLSAWKMALKNRKVAKGLIFNSDRGFQYASNKSIKTIKSCGVTKSMSQKGHCWESAEA